MYIFSLSVCSLLLLLCLLCPVFLSVEMIGTITTQFRLYSFSVGPSTLIVINHCKCPIPPAKKNFKVCAEWQLFLPSKISCILCYERSSYVFDGSLIFNNLKLTSVGLPHCSGRQMKSMCSFGKVICTVYDATAIWPRCLPIPPDPPGSLPAAISGERN